jgi:His/Glu/Gln/Arg/opine family amino acid ABC transporter permease subunit
MDIVQDLLTTFNFIVQGLWVTISVTAVALTVGVAIGIVMAIVRVYGHPALQTAVSAYSVVIRAVPVIVIILFCSLLSRAMSIFRPSGQVRWRWGLRPGRIKRKFFVAPFKRCNPDR